MVIFSTIYSPTIEQCTYSLLVYLDRIVELSTYARELEIPHFRGVFLRETLPQYPFNIECGKFEYI